MAAISVCILLTAISIFVQMPFLGSLEPLRTYQQLACLPGCEVVALGQPQVVLVNGCIDRRLHGSPHGACVKFAHI